MSSLALNKAFEGSCKGENGPVLCVNIMGGKDPLMKIFISSRCDDVTGDGVESLPGLLFRRASWGALFNSISDTGQKFRQ